jgi:hypothetical protein
MNAANQQIVTAFEDLGMSPEEIAEDQDLDVVAVKAILAQSSRRFRKAAAADETLNFSDTELKAANETILQLMQSSEDENIRFRAAKYIRDDKKGRLDAVSKMNGMNVNVLMFNDHMKKALEAVERSRQISSGVVVDVSPTTVSVVAEKQLKQ